MNISRTKDEKLLNDLAGGYSLQEMIIETSELSIITTSPDGVIISFNNGAEQMLGYHAREVIGRSTPEIFHDAREISLRSLELSKELNAPVSAGFQTLIARAKHQKLSERREWTYVHKDGSRFPVSLSLTPLYNEKDQLIAYAFVAINITEEKRALQRIKDSAAQLKSLITSLDDVILEVDKYGKIIQSWNKDLIPFFSQHTIQGQTLTDIFGNKYAQDFENALYRVLQSGQTFSHELRMTWKGEECWFSVKYSLLMNNGKPANKVTVCIEDVTKRKQTELSLRASEEKFRLLAENIPGVIYLCRNDSNYSMLYLSDKVETLTGYPAADFLNGAINFVELFHQEDRERIIHAVSSALNERTSFDVEYRLHHRSGEIRWVHETGIGVYSKDNLLMIEGYINDITSARKAEDTLHHISKESYRVFNSSINLAVVVDFECNFIKMNHAWEKTLGWSLDELERGNFISFIHPDDAERTKVEIKAIIRGDNFSTFENRYRCKDGSYLWLLWSFTPQFDQNFLYGSAIDITTRKKSEEELMISKRNLEVAALELEEQNRQLDEFAHIISHNLRSPVGNINALISFINDDSRLEDYRTIFEKITKVSNNLNETMNELMETLKVKKNTEIEKVEIRFKDVLDKVVQSLEGELMGCAATVTFDFNNATKIQYPKTYMESIFQNLLSNAIKYRSRQRAPKIHFATHTMENRVVLRVIDNGLGIDMAQHGKKLFGLHKTFHTNKEAKGVGLFLTKTQIEAMGGSISAESEVDKGTTFIIQF